MSEAREGAIQGKSEAVWEEIRAARWVGASALMRAILADPQGRLELAALSNDQGWPARALREAVKRIELAPASADVEFSGLERALRGLKEAGASMDACDEEASMEAALFLAARHGSELLFSALLELGASPDLRGPGGQTPIFYAAYFGRERMIGRLLALGADPSARDDTGVTPLWVACAMGEWASALTLLKAGADPFAADELGNTALIRACKRAWAAFDKGEPGPWPFFEGFKECLQALVAAGSDLEAAGQQGLRAIDCLEELDAPRRSALHKEESFKALALGAFARGEAARLAEALANSAVSSRRALARL